MTRNLRILVVCAIVLMVGAAGGLAALLLITASAPQMTRSLTGAIGGPFTLTASDGRTVTDETFRGKWLLIYFGYTSCPDACPTALNNMGVALDRLGAEAVSLQPVFITIDPKRDTQEALAEYLKSFDPHIVALTGTEQQIAAVVKEYHIYVEVQPGSGSDYLVNHSSFFYLINRNGKFVNIVHGEASGEELADKVRQLMKGSV
jgi:protein SCO1/2